MNRSEAIDHVLRLSSFHQSITDDHLIAEETLDALHALGVTESEIEGE